MLATRLKAFLDEKHVKYVTIDHSPAFTAQEVAQRAHIPGKEMAKTVIVKIDGKLAMVVIPASETLRLSQLKTALGVDSVELASEYEFKDAFPDCETGAMPPFGNLYGMKVYISPALRDDEVIAFNAGTHKELVRLNFSDFERLVEPQLLAA